MKTMLTGSIGLATALALGVLAAPSADSSESMRRIGNDKVMITDFSGKPPFRRRTVDIDDLSTAEFARFEEIRNPPAVDETRIGQRITAVDFRGKPPFRRRVVEIDESNVTEFARFEEVTEADDGARNSRFKRHRFGIKR